MKEILLLLISMTTFSHIECDSDFNWYVTITINQEKTTNHITICKQSKRDKNHVLIHELWHVYWYNIMTDKQKEQWKKLHEYSKNKPNNLNFFEKWFTSEYWATNYEEDFSEYFLYIYRKWKDNYKSRFIKRIILINKIIKTRN